jgi:DNA-binding LacI/PurR family transcriptional regulator
MPELMSIHALGIPIVNIVRSFQDERFDTIAIDNEGGAFRATEYALEQGHRRIAIISSPEHTSACSERIAGYLRALEKYKVSYRKELIRFSDPGPESGYRTTKELCCLPAPPTALFIASNFPLLGSLRALKELGIKAPRDISLICFDDPDWGPYLNPPLTAIRPDTDALCSSAVGYLFDRITNKYDGAARKSVIGTELIIRNSVSPPKK